jgi:hypothetical protein
VIGSTMFARRLITLIGLAAMLAPAARAQDSLPRSIAKTAGFAADPAPPADFVRKSRPAEEKAPIPVFQPPNEPPSRIKSKSELKALDADLESAARKHDKLRAGFAPAARAAAAEEAARKRNSPKP